MDVETRHLAIYNQCNWSYCLHRDAIASYIPCGTVKYIDLFIVPLKDASHVMRWLLPVPGSWSEDTVSWLQCDTLKYFGFLWIPRQNISSMYRCWSDKLSCVGLFCPAICQSDHLVSRTQEFGHIQVLGGYDNMTVWQYDHQALQPGDHWSMWRGAGGGDNI